MEACGAGALLSVTVVSAAKNHEKRPSKSLVQVGIQEGVQSWVNVPQPQPGCPNLPGYRVMDEGVHHIRDEKWRPAQGEAAHYDRQCLCCSRLNAHASVSSLRLFWGQGPGRCPQAVVIPWIRGVGRLYGYDLVRMCRRKGAGTVKSLYLPDMDHGSDIDALIGQNHEGQRHVEGDGRADQGVRLVDQKHTTCVGASRKGLLLFNLTGDKEIIVIYSIWRGLV